MSLPNQLEPETAERDPQDAERQVSDQTRNTNDEKNGGDHSLQHRKWNFWSRFPRSLPKSRTFAEYCPLVAAILAPTTTLLDIPALTQHWYYRYGVPQSDPTASLVLSALGLALNLIANILLVIRFSSRSKKWWQAATQLSTILWIAKTLVAFANLLVFGILTRNQAGFAYQQGFWCAVISIIGAGICSVMLLMHYFFIFRHRHDKAELRMEGRRFMLSVTAFEGIMAIQALVFSKIEGWTYLDGIYFSVETALTIGFGDLLPTKAAGKVLVFVFSVLTISQLGNEVAIIVSFISSRADQRRERWRKHYEGSMHREAYATRGRTNLLEEMALVHEIRQREEMMDQMYDLIWSAASLLLFWLVGAAIFSSLEDWSYGNAIYMVMILSLTIGTWRQKRPLTAGFGDFAPKTPAGRVVFVVYALMAVPIVTSFAVQTITGLLSTYSERGATRDKFRQIWHNEPETFTSHAEFVAKSHKVFAEIKAAFGGPVTDEPDRIDEEMDDVHDAVQQGEADAQKEVKQAIDVTKQNGQKGREPDQPKQRSRSTPGGAKPNGRAYSNGTTNRQNGKSGGREWDQTVGEVDELDRELVKRLLKLVVKFEAGARQLLIENMDDQLSRTLLLADRNVQYRDMVAITGLSPGELKPEDDGDEDDGSEIGKIRKYRRTFADILVLGAALQKLEGSEKKLFERWQTWSPDEAHTVSAEMDQYRDDLDKIADKSFDGLTGRILKRHIHQQQRMLKRAATLG